MSFLVMHIPTRADDVWQAIHDGAVYTAGRLNRMALSVHESRIVDLNDHMIPILQKRWVLDQDGLYLLAEEAYTEILESDGMQDGLVQTGSGLKELTVRNDIVDLVPAENIYQGKV